MRQSDLNNKTGEAEFKLIRDQRHVDQVWALMEALVNEYADGFLAALADSGGQPSPKANYNLWLSGLIKDNEDLRERYRDIFDLEALEEYEEDPDEFKGDVLRKQCPIIRHSLQSRAQVMQEWKAKYYARKSIDLVDAFTNMMSFAEEYDEEMDEPAMEALDRVDDCRIAEMEDEDSENGRAYISGVLGYGIVSNILNHMYPRTFPGNYKMGVWSLYFLAKGSEDLMPSGTSEFSMLKDDRPNHVGAYEMEHNYTLAYEIFCIYTLRIWRLLAPRIETRFGAAFPSEHRFLLTNSFYEYVASKNSANIATLAGNDDILKFTTSW